MSDQAMHVHRLTIDGCARIHIQADLENGCVQLTFYDDRGRKWTRLDVVAFGIDNEPPGIEIAKPLELEPEEAYDQQQDALG